MTTFAIPIREHSSAGLEHLPYKQRVGGSNPSTPTTERGLVQTNPLTFAHIDFILTLLSRYHSDTISKGIQRIAQKSLTYH